MKNISFCSVYNTYTCTLFTIYEKVFKIQVEWKSLNMLRTLVQGEAFVL